MPRQHKRLITQPGSNTHLDSERAVLRGQRLQALRQQLGVRCADCDGVHGARQLGPGDQCLRVARAEDDSAPRQRGARQRAVLQRPGGIRRGAIALLPVWSVRTHARLAFRRTGLTVLILLSGRRVVIGHRAPLPGAQLVQQRLTVPRQAVSPLPLFIATMHDAP
jgi:hypothetical protein